MKIKMEKTNKIFVVGFYNSGKSTLIHSLDDKSIHIEKKLKRPGENGKTHTTTGFDLGRMIWARPNLNEETNGVIMSKTEFLRDKAEYSKWYIGNFELKGCPGQTQFTAVRKVIAKGSDGVIFLIDGCDMGNIGNALVILEETRVNLGNDIPMKIIANKSDRSDFQGSEMISNMVGEEVFEGSGKCQIGVKDGIIEVLKMTQSYGNLNQMPENEEAIQYV